jgi:leucyl/phenylalanyl-tRNA--protein transferase
MPPAADEPDPARPTAGDPDRSPPADLLVRAYLAGCFPMAEPGTGEVRWYSPDPRAIQPFADGDPLGAFHIRRSLAKRVRNKGLRVTIDRAFPAVIAACAEPRAHEADTWISPGLMRAYQALHDHGVAHSVEAWHDNALVGGVYGVALGGAFFGESMFSRVPYGSQVCLVHLVDHLQARGYTLFDVQFVNPHLEQFGVVEVRRDHYLRLLAVATALPVSWASA